MAVYNIDGCQDSCYPGTTVLVNKLNIRDQKSLTNAESILVTSCSAKVEKYMKFQKVDFEFYKNIHKQIFGDLYEWAGQLRKINISKKGTVFCEYTELEKIGKLKFQRLKNYNYLRDMSDMDFINELADLYHELNMLHPFREGNGRTLRLFITLLVRNTGRDINFAECDADLLTIATIKAAQGDETMLKMVFSEMII
ncbi:MAG: Fic family protein [Lachnospiraceae bacterium]|nr:Fic family protein [Lachnospiraceae bacterium]MBQ6944376.1 Fic family protein [Ruminococcus sp.]